VGRVGSYPDAFSARVATNLALGEWRQAQRRFRRSSTLAAHASDPDPVAHDALVREVRKLPRRQREVVFLRYFADLSLRDTAAALGCSEGAVNQHAARALAHLRQQLSLDSSEEEP
jgi:RNA polymerase sigma factor (sigma-70 family)